MKELNPEAINSILNILTFFSYTTILFGLVFLFYFIRYEFLEHELTRQQKIRALIFLLASIAPNFVISLVAQKLDAGLYVNFGIFFFALSCVSAKAVFKKNYKIFSQISTHIFWIYPFVGLEDSKLVWISLVFFKFFYVSFC